MKHIAFLFLLFFVAVVKATAQHAYVPSKAASSKDTTKQEAITKPVLLKPVPVSYNYYNHLGAACKVEFKLEKATSIPFRFRLGSLQQTDYLEQKPNARKPD